MGTRGIYKEEGGKVKGGWEQRNEGLHIAGAQRSRRLGGGSLKLGRA